MAQNLWGQDQTLTTAGQSIYEESATQKHRLGARLVLGDRVFRYCKNGDTALVAGTILQSAANMGFGEEQKKLTVSTAGSSGTKDVYVTLTGTSSLTADALKDGYLSVHAGTGAIGGTYRIKSNPVATATTSPKITVYDEFAVTVATTDTVAIAKSPFMGVIVHPTTPTGIPIGVPLIAVSTASYYFWAQTWGPVSCLCDTALTHDAGLQLSVASAGAVELEAGDNMIVGYSCFDMTTVNYGLIYLQIMP